MISMISSGSTGFVMYAFGFSFSALMTSCVCALAERKMNGMELRRLNILAKVYHLFCPKLCQSFWGKLVHPGEGGFAV